MIVHALVKKLIGWYNFSGTTYITCTSHTCFFKKVTHRRNTSIQSRLMSHIT